MKHWKQSLTIFILLFCGLSFLFPKISQADSGLSLLGVSAQQATPTPVPSNTPTFTPTFTPTPVPAGFNVLNYYTGGTVQFAFDYTDTTKVLNSGGTSATNGQKIDTVNPALNGGTLVLDQNTDANRPTLTTNITNGKQGGVFTGSPMVMPLTGAGNTSVVRNTQLVSFGAAFRLNSTGSNAAFIRMYDNTWSHHRFRPFLATAQPSLDVQKADGTGTTTVNASVVLATGTVHVVLWEVDLVAGTCTIYANNAVTSVNGTACAGGAGTFANTTANDVMTNLTSGMSMFTMHLVSGAKMDGTQRAAYFADMKTLLGITVY